MSFKIFSCLVCHEACSHKDYFCTKCVRDMACRLNPRCGENFAYRGFPLEWLGSYEGAFARLIIQTKKTPYGFIDESLRRFYRELVEHRIDILKRIQADAIVRVPSHPLRSFFESDLSALFCSEVIRVKKCPEMRVLHSTWERILNPLAQQKNFSRAKRQLNVTKMYRVTKASKKLRLLIVDDVCTTGATLSHVWHLLKEAGYEPVHALVLALVPRTTQQQRP